MNTYSYVKDRETSATAGYLDLLKVSALSIAVAVGGLVGASTAKATGLDDFGANGLKLRGDGTVDDNQARTRVGGIGRSELGGSREGRSRSERVENGHRGGRDRMEIGHRGGNDRMERSIRSERVESGHGGERVERAERMLRADRGERSGHAERIELGGHGGGSGRGG